MSSISVPLATLVVADDPLARPTDMPHTCCTLTKKVTPALQVGDAVTGLCDNVTG